MKKRTFLTWGVVLILAAGAGFFMAPSLSRGQGSPVTLTLAPETLDFDGGLDARDALNRPVKALQARARLRALFVSSLYALLLQPELPRVAEVLAFLKKSWDFSFPFLCRAGMDFWRGFTAFFAPSQKRFSPFLLFLAGLFLTAAAGAVRKRFLQAAGRLTLLSHLSTVVIRR